MISSHSVPRDSLEFMLLGNSVAAFNLLVSELVTCKQHYSALAMSGHFFCTLSPHLLEPHHILNPDLNYKCTEGFIDSAAVELLFTVLMKWEKGGKEFTQYT